MQDVHVWCFTRGDQPKQELGGTRSGSCHNTAMTIPGMTLKQVRI
jgi:hypothetical protein